MSNILSRRCCGGPVLVLALAFTILGGLFIALSATPPGLVFIASGMGALGACLMMSRGRCPNIRGPLSPSG